MLHRRVRRHDGRLVMTGWPPHERRAARHADAVRDVVHRVGDLDLVPGVAAEQAAVLVAELGDDVVTVTRAPDGTGPGLHVHGVREHLSAYLA